MVLAFKTKSLTVIQDILSHISVNINYELFIFSSQCQLNQLFL